MGVFEADRTLKAVQGEKHERFISASFEGEFSTDEKKPAFSSRFLKLVGERGFEPPTHWSQTSCATKLRYSPNTSFCHYFSYRCPNLQVLSKNPAVQQGLKIGRRERIRTSDPLVPNQLRYQAALLAEYCWHFFATDFVVRREGLEPSRPLRH